MNQQHQTIMAEIMNTAGLLLMFWELQGWDPDAPFFEEIAEEVSPLSSGLYTSISSYTGEPAESISPRRGLEFLMLIAARVLNIPLPEEVRDRLVSNIFGSDIADALDLGVTTPDQARQLVLSHPRDETVH